MIAIYTLGRFLYRTGDKQENLELMRLLVDQGLDVNAKLPYGIKAVQNGLPRAPVTTMFGLVGSSCDEDLVQLFVQSGADPHSDRNAWYQILQGARNLEEGTPEYENCVNMSLKFLATETDLPEYLAKNILASGKDEYFNLGSDLQGLLPEPIWKELKTRFNLTYGQQPQVPHPGKLWEAIYYKHFKYPFGDLGLTRDAEEFWDSFSDDQKSWTCYLTTFDEYVDFLKGRGWTEYDLTEKKHYSNLFVKTIAPYCSALK